MGDCIMLPRIQHTKDVFPFMFALTECAGMSILKSTPNLREEAPLTKRMRPTSRKKTVNK